MKYSSFCLFCALLIAGLMMCPAIAEQSTCPFDESIETLQSAPPGDDLYMQEMSAEYDSYSSSATAAVEEYPGYAFSHEWGEYGASAGEFDYPFGVAVDSACNVYVCDSNNDCIRKFDSEGCFLASWGSEGRDYGEFNTPRGIAVDDVDNVYVVDGVNCRIQKFSSDGTFLLSWGSFGSRDEQLHHPHGIAVGPTGDIYVADFLNYRIQKYKSDGTHLGSWGSEGYSLGEFTLPQDIAVDSLGNVYVADTGNDRIQKFTSDGTLLTFWGSHGIDEGEFSYPCGIAVDVEDNVYVSDGYKNRIQKFSPDGTFLSSWGSYGSDGGEFHRPQGIAVNPTDNIYIADSENNRIQKFTSDGTFMLSWGSWSSGIGEFNYPSGIAIDDSDIVYVADANNNRIQTFDPDGTFRNIWGEEGNSTGEFMYPKGIALDSAGNSYITDSWNNRIQSFASDGTFRSTWGTAGSDEGAFNQPFGIAVDSIDTVYVADFVNHRIQTFDTDGNYMTSWGTKGSGEGEFVYPFGVAVNASDWVYVADTHNHRIQVFEPDGTYLMSWGSEGSGFGEFMYPRGIAFDFADNVYVADTWNNRIQKFAANGTYLTAWGTSGDTAGAFDSPTGIAVNSEGDVYAVDTNNHRIEVFSPVTLPRANFTVDKTSGLLPLTVQFTDTSEIFPTGWEWNFGDDHYCGSTDQNPTHTYYDPGTYNVTLTVTNDAGPDSITKTNLITVSMVTAKFDLNRNFVATTAGNTFIPGSHTANLTYRLHAATSTPNATLGNLRYFAGLGRYAGGNITSVNYPQYASWSASDAYWNFPSEYVITSVSGFDTQAGTSTTEDYIYNHTINRTNNASIFRTDAIQHTSVTIVFDDLDFESVFVGFAGADNSNVTTEIIPETVTTDAPLVELLPAGGAYHLELNTPGLTIGTEYSFTFDTRIHLNGSPVIHKPLVYVWEGMSHETANVRRSSRARVPYNMCPADAREFWVDTNRSCDWTVVRQDNLLSVIEGRSQRVPVAEFTASPQVGAPPLTVTFTDLSTEDPSNWLWDFGDGTNSIAQNPVHAYTTVGLYPVTLSVNGEEFVEMKYDYIRVTSLLLGDANSDGTVNQADTLHVLKEVVGINDAPEGGTDAFERTDVHWNGFIDIGDAMFIAQYNVGLRDQWFVQV